jgi:hypothetical protein
VKLKEHQMQDKITDFFPRYCQIFIGQGHTPQQVNRSLLISITLAKHNQHFMKKKQVVEIKKSPGMRDYYDLFFGVLF